MRRSLRDAIVGFSLLGGVLIFSGTMLWLRGFRIGSNSWEVEATFNDATGLAEMSPVTYRGIIVGSIKKISFTPESVNARIVINKKDLILPKPVTAKITTSSVLGGDAQLSLISLNSIKNKKLNPPQSSLCNRKEILCKDDIIKGEKMISISTLTEGIEGIIDEADKQDIIDKVSKSIDQFDQTQANLDELILLSKLELLRAAPIINELNKASTHLANILSSIDNPQTLNDIKEVAHVTNSLTKKIDSMSSDIDEIIKDKELIEAIRSVTIGLGKLFNEIYP